MPSRAGIVWAALLVGGCADACRDPPVPADRARGLSLTAFPRAPEGEPPFAPYEEARARWRTATTAFAHAPREAADVFWRIAEAAPPKGGSVATLETLRAARCFAYENAVASWQAAGDLDEAREAIAEAMEDEASPCPATLAKLAEELALVESSSTAFPPPRMYVE